MRSAESIFDVLAEPNRRRILDLLRGRDRPAAPERHLEGLS